MATLTLRPNADGSYSQFVEVPNAGFIFGDQFESGDFTAWTSTSGTPTIVNSPVHHGGNSASFNALTEYITKSITATSIVYARCYVRIDELPATGKYVSVMGLVGVSGELVRCYFRENSGKQFTMQLLSPNTIWDVAWNYAINTWYCMEIMVKISGTVGEIHGWIDGVELHAYTNIDTNDYGNINAVDVGSRHMTAATSVDLYIDCVVVSTTDFGLEDRAALVSDESDLTGLQVTNSITQKTALNLADHTTETETINSVTTYARAKYAAGDGDEKFKIILMLGATEGLGAEKTTTGSLVDYSDVWNLDPDGGAWSWADIDALQIGAIPTALGAAETIFISDYKIVVDFTVAGGLSIPVAMYHYSQMTRIRRG